MDELLTRIDFQNIAVVLYFLIFAVVALGLWLIAIWPVHKLRDSSSEIPRINHLGVLIALVIVILKAGWLSELEGWAGAAPVNVIFLFHCIILISYGCKTVNIKLTTAGCLLFSLIAVTRYADLFESLLLRSLVFLLIGAGIFTVGIFYSKAKKKMQGKTS